MLNWLVPNQSKRNSCMFRWLLVWLLLLAFRFLFLKEQQLDLTLLNHNTHINNYTYISLITYFTTRFRKKNNASQNTTPFLLFFFSFLDLESRIGSNRKIKYIFRTSLPLGLILETVVNGILKVCYLVYVFFKNIFFFYIYIFSLLYR